MIAVLKREIYAGLGLFSSRFKLTIRVRMNTAPPGSFYFSLFRIENEELWDTIKQNAAQLVGFRVIELVVEAHRRTDQTNYDPCPDSLPGGSNTPPVQTDYDPWAGSTPVPNYTTPVHIDYDPWEDSTPVNTDTPPHQIPGVNAEQSDHDHGYDTSSTDDDDDPMEGQDLHMDEVEAEINVQEILKE